MNQPIMVFTAAMLYLCMTGCSGGDQLTTQKDSVPIMPAETTQFSVTGESSAGHTEAVTTLTDTLNGQTETASAESRTSAAAETAPTAAVSQTDAETAAIPQAHRTQRRCTENGKRFPSPKVPANM
jgi:hypothetical protein